MSVKREASRAGRALGAHPPYPAILEQVRGMSPFVELRKFLMIGAENADWVTCIPLLSSDAAGLVYFQGGIGPVVNNTNLAQNITLNWAIPLPTNRGGLSLRVSQMRIVTIDADDNNLIDERYLTGINSAGAVQSSLASNLVEIKTVTTTTWDLTDVDYDGYIVAGARTICDTDTDFALDFWMAVEAYYL